MSRAFDAPAIHIAAGDHIIAPSLRGNITVFDVLNVRTVGACVQFTGSDVLNGPRTERNIGRDTEVRILRVS